MNVQNWGIGRIMELPDWCFGRRFVVGCTLNQGPATDTWDISEVALPEMCVVWELHILATGTFNEWLYLGIALGDQLPTNLAMFDALDPLFMGLGEQGREPRRIRVDIQRTKHLDRLRMPVAANGRRLVIEGRTEEQVSAGVQVEIVVSGVPKEVPDWLVSGSLRSP